MLLRFAVFGLMALGLGGFGTVVWIATRPPSVAHVETPSSPPLPRRTILAAAGPLRGGTLLKPGNLTAVEITSPPAGAQDDTAAGRSDLAGAMLRRSLLSNEPVLLTDVIRPGDHGFLAAVLAPNMRAASVGVDNVSGSAGLIWPGDRVDLILTQTLDGPALPASHRVAAETVLSNVRVIAIDQMLARGVAPSGDAGANSSRTVTLEVTPAQAERVAVATRLGRLSLSVRSADMPDSPSIADHGPPSPVQTTWGGDVSPALGRPASVPDATVTTLRVFQGTEGKEFKF